MTTDDRFSELDSALRRGDIAVARRFAERLVGDASSGKDARTEGAALLRLAYCDLADSRIQRARSGAIRAASLLREGGLPCDEVDALALAARAASILGRTVEAIETALLATQLAGELPSGLWTPRAYASLGLAHGWARAFAQSDKAFEVAAQAASRNGDAAVQLEVGVARAWVRSIRCFDEGRRADFCRDTVLDQLLGPQDLFYADSTTMTPGAVTTLPRSGTLVAGLMSLWAGNVEAAKGALARCAQMNASAVGWTLSAESWLAAELALAAGDLEAASLHATRMAVTASDVEHLPLQTLGHELASDIYARQGNLDLTLKEKHLHLKCERLMRSRDLEGCSDFASLRLQARRGDAQVKELVDKSLRFEKWAHEDALTGIANLRRFDQCLAEWSPGSEDGGKPLCVALIDVDRFRDINNNYSYEVGNQALQGIAAEMTAHVRATDLAARWGGDEFAILFRDTDRQTAEQVALRIQQAVRQRDWSSVAQGLGVSVSVGVTEAHAGDSKASIIARSEDLMYAQKVARKRAEVEQAVAPLILQKVTAWLREAERVVVFVGAGSRSANNPASASDGNDALSAVDRRRFGDAQALQCDPEGFADFWNRWRLGMRSRKPSEAHVALVELAHRLPEVLFITERVDGVLAMAGAENVIELYGNAFRRRCSTCGRVNSSSDYGRCLPCGASTATLRPDIVLLGEAVDQKLLAGAEWAVKRAGVILVVDSDASIHPGSSLIEKGQARGARVVVLGESCRARRGAEDVTIAAAPEAVARILARSLEEVPVDDGGDALSEEGFAIFSYLTGRRSDNLGVTLEGALQWKDWEISKHLRSIPWMFPLPTRSAVNPEAPAPTRRDFEFLATDEVARGGMRQAFLLMLRYYGFEWRDGRVSRSEGWRTGFAIWAITGSHHDLFISRILGALALTGLQDEASRFHEALAVEVRRYRGDGAHRPMWHWNLAVTAGRSDVGS